MLKRTGRYNFYAGIFCLVLIFCFVGLNLYGSSARAVDYRHELDELSREFYRQGRTEEILSELSARERELSDRDKDHNYFVQKAEIEIFRGEIKEVADLESAEDNFAAALEYAEQALEKENTSRANRQAAEALSMLFNYRSTFFIIRNAGKAESYLENSRELAAEENMMNRLMWANFYLEAPETFGGDREKGREIFQEIRDMGHPVFELAVLNTLGRKYEESGEEEQVENLRDRFAEIFPESPWLEKFPLR